MSFLSKTIKGRRIFPVPPGSKPFFLAPTVEIKTVLFITCLESEIYTAAHSSLNFIELCNSLRSAEDIDVWQFKMRQHTTDVRK